MVAKKDRKQKKQLSHVNFVNFFILLFCSLFVLFILAAQYIGNQEKKLADRIYPNVFMDSKPIGGKTKDEIAAEYRIKNEKLKTIAFTILYKNTPIATLSAEKLNLHSNGEEIIDRAYLIGRSSHGLSRLYQKLLTLFGIKSFSFYSRIVYDKSILRDFISDEEDHYNKPAKNALFTFENGKVVQFKEDEKGLKINSEKLVGDIDAAINSLNTNTRSQTIVLTDTLIDPEITLKNSNNMGIEELIGEGKSNYSHSSAERIHNLSLAATKFNGVIIPKDKMISFNDLVGDISTNTGYKPAYIIQNGKTVLGDGGGVCQVSTTLFRAALHTGLPIVERTAHAYRVLYYENDSKPGFDATVFSPSVDLKIKNDTPASILILVENDRKNMELTFKFYGKKDNRKVELSDATITDEQPPPPALYQDDPTLKKGVTKQVDFAAWGAKSVFTYKVTKGEDVLFEKKFVSYFKPWQAVYLVGTAD